MPKLAHLKFNDPAPDLDLQDADGKTVRLSSLWNKQTLILAFTRHFGCPQCKELVDQLAIQQPAFRSRNRSLAIITQGTPEETRLFCSERAPGVICLADPERKSYAAYGLERAAFAARLRKVIRTWTRRTWIVWRQSTAVLRQ